ncbi:MAG TPA: SDR family oxidoreductase [Bacteroidota bacterium]|nr:SDR family oxidoreductase [Bacteroidota bacterium]
MARTPPKVDLYRPVVWVVGASRGIGREIAKHFASIGCEVCLSSRSERDLHKVAKEITSLGGRANIFPGDFSEEHEILKTAKRILKTFQHIDVLINNAGITVFKSFLDTTIDEFDDIIDSNLEGPIICIKAVLPSMIKQKKGWIVNILSNAAVKTFEGSAAYTATKAGLQGVSRVLREEMKPFNIKVTSVIPGPVDTNMWSASMRKKHAHRMITAKSVAETILSIYQLPDDVVVDEIIIRPLLGDID